MNARKIKKQQLFAENFKAMTRWHASVSDDGTGTPTAYYLGVRAEVAKAMNVSPCQKWHKMFNSYWAGWLWQEPACPQWQASPVFKKTNGTNWNKKLARVPSWYF